MFMWFAVGVPSVFEVIGEPSRRELLELLQSGPRPVGELCAHSGLSQPSTSKHLRALREAGLVEARTAGRRRLYGLRAEGFAELARWLVPYARLWQERLDALERRLAEDA
jgi:DNA-binding transcriptional ArsR family regulator